MFSFVKSLPGMGLLFFFLPVSSLYAADVSEYEKCLARAVMHDAGETRAADIKKSCEGRAGLVDFSDKSAAKPDSFHQYSIMAFKPNYILPFSYNFSDRDSSAYQQQFANQDVSLDNAEAQFQISIKALLLTGVSNSDVSLSAAYTNRSFWQVFNKDLSSPFRETNHEPEVWLSKPGSVTLFGFSNLSNTLGLSHQSNGRGGALSRSWNRVYTSFVFEKESLVLRLKLWTRLQEKARDDDNRDITNYLGYGELRAVYVQNNHSFSVMSRNNLESGFKKGALEIAWSFPIGKRKDLKGYAQLFSGFGESLIDYDNRVNSIGLGVSISDWL